MIIEKKRIPLIKILTIGILPNFCKKWLYRVKGYRIGKRVKIGFGSIVEGQKVIIGKDTKISFMTIIRGDKIKIGAHVIIGSTTFIDTPNLNIGDDTIIREQVFIGGLKEPDSKFEIGKNSLIQQVGYINPAKSIIIGDNSSIGGHGILLGHTSWNSVFDGYSVKYEPIVIGNNVGVSWRVTILAGIKIGDNVIIGSNSLINKDIPSKCIASGFPVRVISRNPAKNEGITLDERKKLLEKIIYKMFIYFQKAGLKCNNLDGYRYSVKLKTNKWLCRKNEWILQVSYDPISDGHKTRDKKIDVYLSLQSISKQNRRKLNLRKIFWIDIDRKERSELSNIFGEEVIQYLKRFGVRLNRVSIKI